MHSSLLASGGRTPVFLMSKGQFFKHWSKTVLDLSVILVGWFICMVSLFEYAKAFNLLPMFVFRSEFRSPIIIIR